MLEKNKWLATATLTVLLVMTTLSLSACGQYGSLYMPDKAAPTQETLT